MSIIVASPLAIVTPNLPAANLGVSYSFTLQASGGSPPFNWLVAAGALPAGITSSTSGVISGTPTGAGTVNFTARVTDGVGQQVIKAFDLAVLAPVAAPATGPRANIGLGTLILALGCASLGKRRSRRGQGSK